MINLLTLKIITLEITLQCILTLIRNIHQLVSTSIQAKIIYIFCHVKYKLN